MRLKRIILIKASEQNGSMKKDIEYLKVTEVALAVVPEANADGTFTFLTYLINLKEAPIVNVLIRSRGSGIVNEEKVQTSVLRHLFEEVGPKEGVKIELVPEELLNLSNEYWVSFWYEDYLYDKKYTFVPGSIIEQNYTQIPIIDRPGVMIK